MITAVIFSRDRAMQLDALLRSLPDGLDPVYVVVRATTKQHRDAYRMLMGETDRAALEWQKGSLPGRARALLEGSELACFLTDDSVFYRPSMLPDELPPDVICHSLRLGANTDLCYSLKRAQRIPQFITDATSMIWAWSKADGDFDYPGSLDGHIFRTSHLRRALLACPPDANPNRIEEHLNQWLKTRLEDGFSLMTAEAHSSLVGIPVNRVNETHPNRVGAGPSVDELCERYLAGDRIALDRMDFSDIHSAHQEVALVTA